MFMLLPSQKRSKYFLKIPYLYLDILYYNTHKEMMSFVIRAQMLIKLLTSKHIANKHIDTIYPIAYKIYNHDIILGKLFSIIL